MNFLQKKSKLLLLLLFILPWLTLPLLRKNDLKRFLPAGIFISLVVWAESIYARKNKWWWFYETLHPKLTGEFPLIWGPFLIGSMWILKLTYGRFLLYTVLNIIVDAFFTYPFIELCRKAGIGSLVRLKKYQLSILFFIKSLLMYGFQTIREKV